MAGKLLVKAGVEFKYHPAGFRILEVLRDVAQRLQVDLTITSGSDGLHSGPTDPHKSGEAYDVRSQDLSPAVKQAVLGAIWSGLMPDATHRKFYAFLEAPGTSNEHFHCQRRNATVYTIYDYLA